MATWRVFKKLEGYEAKGERTVASWDEYPLLESEYDYAVNADEVGKVAGAGEYLLFKQGEYARAVEIEVRAITRYETVEPEPEVAEPEFSVAVPIHGGDDS